MADLVRLHHAAGNVQHVDNMDLPAAAVRIASQDARNIPERDAPDLARRAAGPVTHADAAAIPDADSAAASVSETRAAGPRQLSAGSLASAGRVRADLIALPRANT